MPHRHRKFTLALLNWLLCLAPSRMESTVVHPEAQTRTLWLPLGLFPPASVSLVSLVSPPSPAPQRVYLLAVNPPLPLSSSPCLSSGHRCHSPNKSLSQLPPSPGPAPHSSPQGELCEDANLIVSLLPKSFRGPPEPTRQFSLATQGPRLLFSPCLPPPRAASG